MSARAGITDLLVLFLSTPTHLLYNSRLSVMSELLAFLLVAPASSGASASWSFLRIQFHLLHLDTLGLFTGTQNAEPKRKKDLETGRWRRRRRCCGLNSQMSGGPRSMYLCMPMSWFLESVNMTSCEKNDLCGHLKWEVILGLVVWMECSPQAHWSSIGGAVWVGLAGEALWRRFITCRGAGMGFEGLRPHCTSSSLWFELVVWDMSCKLPAPAVMPATCYHIFLQETLEP